VCALVLRSRNTVRTPVRSVCAPAYGRGLFWASGRARTHEPKGADQAPFAGLFLADKDRLEREQFETNHILKQISQAGVHIFEYQNGGHEVRLDSPIDKLIMSVSNFAAELERAKASQRTRGALKFTAQRGYVVGGAVFRLPQRPSHN